MNDGIRTKWRSIEYEYPKAHEKRVNRKTIQSPEIENNVTLRIADTSMFGKYSPNWKKAGNNCY